jgi:hypothetical protein
LGSRTEEYPGWAPSLLVERHRALKAELAQLTGVSRTLEAELRRGGRVLFLTVQERLDLLEALVFNQNMKDVWASLNRRRAVFDRRLPKIEADAPAPFRPAGTPAEIEVMEAHYKAERATAETIRRSPALCLLGACEGPLLAWDVIPKESTPVVKARFLQVAKHAETLCDLLPKVRWVRVGGTIDFAATMYYPSDESHRTMAEMLRLDADSPLHNFFVDSPGNNPFQDTSPWSNLPEFLEKLAKLARERAKKPPRVAPQQNSPRAKLRNFVYELSRYFSKAYGQPFHEQVAIIASAVFSRDVSAENVRKLVRDRGKPADPETSAG